MNHDPKRSQAQQLSLYTTKAILMVEEYLTLGGQGGMMGWVMTSDKYVYLHTNSPLVLHVSL